MHRRWGRLLLAPDGRLIGVANVGVYRYDPVTDTVDVLVGFGSSGFFHLPGPLVMTPDGSLYGTTNITDSIFTTLASGIFRLRPTSGPYVLEGVQALGLTLTTGLSDRAQLTRGADGLIYGYGQRGGGGDAGNVVRVRFRRVAGRRRTRTRSPSCTSSHRRRFGARPSRCSDPTAGVDGDRESRRPWAAWWHLHPGTAGDRWLHPCRQRAGHRGQSWITPNVNSSLILGPDNALYGTTTATFDNGIVRFVPATNAVTNAPTTFLTTHSGFPMVDPAMVKAPAGDFYFVRGRNVYRVAPQRIFTMLGEKSTAEIAKSRDAKGFIENFSAAKTGGGVAGAARIQLEIETGERVVSTSNFLGVEKRGADPVRLSSPKKPEGPLSARLSRHRPLPVAAPVPALGVVQRVGGHPLVLVAVGLAAHILAPCHLASIEAEVDAADVVVLAELGPAQAREVALGLIGAGAIVRERDAVVDPLGGEAGMQGIPAGRLISVDGRAVGDAAGNHGHALILGLDHERQRAALALAHDDHDAALAGLMLG